MLEASFFVLKEIEKLDTFITTTTNTKVAVIVGTGAVEKGWEPILNIFRGINNNETNPDSANFLFAKSICALRLYSKLPKGAK